MYQLTHIFTLKSFTSIPHDSSCYFGLSKNSSLQCNLANKMINSPMVSIAQGHSVPLGGVTLFISCIDESSLAIQSNGPGHSFSLAAHISLGFTAKERSRPSVRLIVESLVLPFKGLPPNLQANAMLILSDAWLFQSTLISKQWDFVVMSLRLSKLSYYHIYSSTPTWMSDVTCLLSKLYCTAYLFHYILISE